MIVYPILRPRSLTKTICSKLFSASEKIRSEKSMEITPSIYLRTTSPSSMISSSSSSSMISSDSDGIIIEFCITDSFCDGAIDATCFRLETESVALVAWDQIPLCLADHHRADDVS
ncbi:hypothetical protein V6N11_051108 [Hibiscus sabdariffa]|uniref:Uncharacterized protein n=1 Tax=Hibiscus sabdariffa TaxID=183260 RepID=A0ABR2R319_9ROSI